MIYWKTLAKYSKCSYIVNLDPYYISALAETALVHQVPLLKDAIRSHLALETSLRVRIPVRPEHPLLSVETYAS